MTFPYRIIVPYPTVKLYGIIQITAIGAVNLILLPMHKVKCAGVLIYVIAVIKYIEHEPRTYT
ncbi:hypothetical protein NQ314_012230 [Rhamnusium bicolor]|uniref:Uncharacterized protein n=1 Tax=Rhamnusium bicolor TaxID=1586634 RepID=A0AAV8XC60_9CUCU|nr:hypothetical protein NQ314_012230 [Rhamnusium bicolor]